MSDRDRFIGEFRSFLNLQELTPQDKEHVIEYLLRYLKKQDFVQSYDAGDVLDWNFTGDNIIFNTNEFILQPGYMEVQYEWTKLSSPISTSVLFSCEIDNDYIYVGGDWEIYDASSYWPGGVSSDYVSRYARNTGIWTGIGDYNTSSSAPTKTYGMALDSSGNLYCASQDGLWKWSGGAWSEINLGVSSPYCLCVIISGTDMYVGCHSSDAGIYHYDLGTDTPTSLGTPDSSVFALALDSGGNLYAGGSFTAIGATSLARVGMWNGAAWSALGGGATNGAVRALCVDSNDHVFIGGSFTTPYSRIMKWNGATLSDLGGSFDGYIYALHYKNNKVYVGGNFTTPTKDLAQYDQSFSAIGTLLDTYIETEVWSIKTDSAGNLVVSGDSGLSFYEIPVSSDLLGYTAQESSYLSTDDQLTADSDILYPSQSAVRDYAPKKKVTTSDPTVDDDITLDYRPLDMWLNTNG